MTLSGKPAESNANQQFSKLLGTTSSLPDFPYLGLSTLSLSQASHQYMDMLAFAKEVQNQVVWVIPIPNFQHCLGQSPGSPPGTHTPEVILALLLSSILPSPLEELVLWAHTKPECLPRGFVLGPVSYLRKLSPESQLYHCIYLRTVPCTC